MSNKVAKATQEGVGELAHIIKSDLALIGDKNSLEVYVDSSPAIEVPWGTINTDIEILDTKESDGGILILASIKGDLGFFYSYNNLTETSNFAILNLGNLDNLAFDEEKSVLEEFMTMQPNFKKTWTRNNSEQEWIALKS
jgi:hypothetical protein